MQIKDVLDMETYLAERCYCPNEIYGVDGIFFQLYDASTDCKVLCEGEQGALHGTFIITKPNGGDKEQIIYIEHDGKTVSDCVAFDATENNKEQVLRFMNGEIEKMSINEYVEGETEKALEEMLASSDAVMIS